MSTDGNAQIVVSRVINSIKQGSFTPVIGAGCSLAERDLPSAVGPLAVIQARIESLVKRCADKSTQAYIGSLAKNRDVVNAGRSSASGKDIPTFAQSEDLVTFQLRLAECGAYAAAMCGDHFDSSPSAIIDLGETACGVEVGPECGYACKGLCERLLGLADAAATLAAAEGGMSAKSGLCKRALYCKVLLLIGEIIPCMHASGEALPDCQRRLWGGKHGDAFRLLLMKTRGQPRRVCLRLRHLEWIGKLLWHTLRYDTRLLPSTNELAFQVSVNEEFFPPRVVSLAQAAEITDDQVLVAHLCQWLKQWGADACALTEPYMALAIAMAHSYEVFRAATSETGLPPMVFSTNYDMKMEKALEALYRRRGEGVFYVAIPVTGIRSEPDLKTMETPEWLIQMVTVAGGETVPTFVSARQKSIAFDGPLVVKLHGSPLVPLKAVNRDSVGLGNYTALEHRLVISETDYLQDTVPDLKRTPQNSRPEWLDGPFLKQGRSLCFLGQSLTDWNIRLRLYAEVQHARGVDRLVLNRTVDPYTHVFLRKDNIRIDVGEVDIRQLADAIMKNEVFQPLATLLQ